MDDLSAPRGSKVKFPWCTARSSDGKSTTAAAFARNSVGIFPATEFSFLLQSSKAHPKTSPQTGIRVLVRDFVRIMLLKAVSICRC